MIKFNFEQDPDLTLDQVETTLHNMYANRVAVREMASHKSQERGSELEGTTFSGNCCFCGKKGYRKLDCPFPIREEYLLRVTCGVICVRCILTVIGALRTASGSLHRQQPIRQYPYKNIRLHPIGSSNNRHHCRRPSSSRHRQGQSSSSRGEPARHHELDQTTSYHRS